MSKRVIRLEKDERKARADRLVLARKEAGFRGPVSAAKAFGWPVNNYKAHEAGRNGFGIADARSYAKEFAVRLAWLQFNEGPMREGEELVYEPLPENDPKWRPEPDLDADDAGYVRENYKPKVPGALPELDSSAGGGEGTVGDFVALTIGPGAYSGHKVTAEWLFPAAYLRSEAHAAQGSTIVLPVVGDSMEPSYRPGDRVLVDLSQNQFLNDTVYVISAGGSPPQIKRLTRIFLTDPVEVDIVSDNPAHEKQRVPLDRINIIGRVCGVVARR